MNNLNRMNIITVSVLALFFACISSALSQQENSDYIFLSSIQNEIETKFLEAMENQDDKALTELKFRLDQLDENNSATLGYYKRYWSSYLLYHSSIYYLRSGQLKSSERTIKEAITLLEEIENKDSEVLALLAQTQIFYFQYVPRQDFIIHMGKIKDNLEKSIEFDKNNLRAYYANANYDYYTPKEFGGGQKSERLLLEAISSPSTTSPSPFAPSWGKEATYRLLIEFYIKNENKETASKYLNLLKNEFPSSRILDTLNQDISKP